MNPNKVARKQWNIIYKCTIKINNPPEILYLESLTFKNKRKFLYLESPIIKNIWKIKLFPGEGNGTPLQHSCLGNTMDGGAWWAAVHGVTKSLTRWMTSVSLFTFMHWRRKWQPTPVFLPGESQGRGSLVVLSMRSHRVGHEWSDLVAAAAK